MGAPPRILVVDDDAWILRMVTTVLEKRGYEVETAVDGDAAYRKAIASPPDLLISDVMMPKMDGFTTCREIRKRNAWARIPVIMLTAKGDTSDKVSGLSEGADDYVVKPFSPREVVARVRAVLKRTGRSNIVSSRLDYGPLVIDGLSREVFVDNQPITMTPKEFDLLFYLASSPRQVFSRAQLLDHVWDSSAEWQDPATVTVHMARLRQKIEADPEQPSWLTTVWGVGYRFES